MFCKLITLTRTYDEKSNNFYFNYNNLFDLQSRWFLYVEGKEKAGNSF